LAQAFAASRTFGASRSAHRTRIWLDSAAGRAAGRPSKQEAIFKEKRLMDYVTVTCANKCVGWVKDGKAKIETKCD
jgi:hypothetical protein